MQSSLGTYNLVQLKHCKSFHWKDTTPVTPIDVQIQVETSQGSLPKLRTTVTKESRSRRNSLLQDDPSPLTGLQHQLVSSEIKHIKKVVLKYFYTDMYSFTYVYMYVCNNNNEQETINLIGTKERHRRCCCKKKSEVGNFILISFF